MSKNNVISLGIILSILCFSFMGTTQSFKNSVNTINLVKVPMSYLSKPVISVNKILGSSINDLKESRKAPLPSKKSKKKKLAETIFLILSSVVVSNEKSLILLMIAFVGLTLLYKKYRLHIDKRRHHPPPQMKYYIWWSLRFLTPLRKCIATRADEYDINPIRFTGWGMYIPLKKKPAL
ncbi:hypothetical protein ACFLUV_05720 [Elusimicrobiota bacterium]